jgi:hypothetical protein
MQEDYADVVAERDALRAEVEAQATRAEKAEALLATACAALARMTGPDAVEAVAQAMGSEVVGLADWALRDMAIAAVRALTARAEETP